MGNRTDASQAIKVRRCSTSNQASQQCQTLWKRNAEKCNAPSQLPSFFFQNFDIQARARAHWERNPARSAIGKWNAKERDNFFGVFLFICICDVGSFQKAINADWLTRGCGCSRRMPKMQLKGKEVAKRKFSFSAHSIYVNLSRSFTLLTSSTIPFVVDVCVEAVIRCTAANNN